jgi:hypothetical protein
MGRKLETFWALRRTKSIGFLPSVAPFGKGGQGDFENDFLGSLKMLFCVFPADSGSGPGQTPESKCFLDAGSSPA